MNLRPCRPYLGSSLFCQSIGQAQELGQLSHTRKKTIYRSSATPEKTLYIVGQPSPAFWKCQYWLLRDQIGVL